MGDSLGDTKSAGTQKSSGLALGLGQPDPIGLSGLVDGSPQLANIVGSLLWSVPAERIPPSSKALTVTLQTDIVDRFAQLEQLESEWRELLNSLAQPEPVMTPTWLLTWWRAFGPLQGRELRVVVVREYGTMIGLLPLVRRLAWSLRQPVPSRRLELLGSGDDGPHEICSDYLGAIVRPGSEQAVADAVATLFCSPSFGIWDELCMPKMRADDPFAPAFERALKRHGVTVTIDSSDLSPYIALPASFNEYLYQLKGTHRYLARQTLRRLQKWADTDGFYLHEATDAEALGHGYSILRKLHAARWGDKGGVFASPVFSQFHEGILRELGQHNDGAAEILWLTVGDRPISALYNIVYRGRVRYYQAGRVLDLPKGVRPGIAIHLLAIERAIRAGYSEYDFLATERRYKLALAPRCRRLITLRAIGTNRTAKGLEGCRVGLSVLRNGIRAVQRKF